MDLSYRQEVGVGAIVIAGLTLFTVGMLWLSGKPIVNKGIAVRVVFTNVAGLKEGDPVMVSGVRVGRVAKVQLQGTGRVTITMDLSNDERVRPRRDAGATVSALDFFGAKFVDYFPGSADAYLTKDQVIVGTRQEQLADLASGVATRANELLGNAKQFVSPQLSEDLHNTLVALQRGLTALTTVAHGPMVGEATQTLESAHRVMARFDTLLGNANVQQTGMRVDTLTRNLSQLTTQLTRSTATLDSLLEKVNRGEGTLGRLATDTLVYNDLHRTLDAMTKLLEDLKLNPQRYFHLKVF